MACYKFAYFTLQIDCKLQIDLCHHNELNASLVMLCYSCVGNSLYCVAGERSVTMLQSDDDAVSDGSSRSLSV